MDGDGDGLADTDPLGRFIGTDGAVLDEPTPFAVLNEGTVARDSFGRAIRTDGTRYYDYVDVSDTMLSGVLQELAPWFDPETPTLIQMSRGLPVLLWVVVLDLLYSFCLL